MKFTRSSSSKRSIGLMACAALLLALAGLAGPVHAVTVFTVNSNNDVDDGTCDGTHCSLREAINAANAAANSGGPDEIHFAIPPLDGSLKLITLTDDLPNIAEAVLVDGYTQNGATPNTLADGFNAVLRIYVDGGGTYFMLTVASTSDGTTIKGLVLAQSAGHGININGANSHTQVLGNYILSSDASGIEAGGNNQIGGPNPADRNVISDNGLSGVELEGPGNVVQGNFIGTSPNGLGDDGNTDSGVWIDSPSNTVGGVVAGARNVISGNAALGVDIEGPGAFHNVVAGNYIGTDVTGTNALANGASGISIYGASSNTVGGATAEARNIISGNEQHGVRIGAGSTGNLVAGNFIGTDVTGTLALSNVLDGVRIDEAPRNTVGGTTAGARNVISGNGERGVTLKDVTASGNLVAGNFIGTDVTGTSVLGNLTDGVAIIDAPANQIGGTNAAARNVISGNGELGLSVTGDTAGDNVIAGNYIGTDITGTIAVSNRFSGVTINAPRTILGGTAAGAGNLISGNGSDGVFLSVQYAEDCRVQGNLIGTDATGENPLGNAFHGIRSLSSDANVIGGTTADAGNVIAFNQGDGVRIDANPAFSGHRQAILGNSIYSNNGLGIELAEFDFPSTILGVTPNDALDADGSANGLQNFPILTSAVILGGTTTIAGVFNSEASQLYRLEFFANNECDPSGHGEGEAFIGSHYVTTDAGGNASFSAALVGAMTPGAFITATATDPDNNSSEFSECREAVLAADLGITKAVVSGQAKPGQILVYTLVVTNLGPGEATSAVVNDPVPQGTTFYSASPAPSFAPAIGAGGTVVWNLGNLNSGAGATLTLRVKVSLKGNTLIVNTATVSAATPDPNPANNSATVTSKRKTR